jgi:hypothetical protein
VRAARWVSSSRARDDGASSVDNEDDDDDDSGGDFSVAARRRATTDDDAAFDARRLAASLGVDGADGDGEDARAVTSTARLVKGFMASCGAQRTRWRAMQRMWYENAHSLCVVKARRSRASVTSWSRVVVTLVPTRERELDEGTRMVTLGFL